MDPVPASDMMVDGYDEVDDEKQEAAIINTPGSSSPEIDAEPLADDFEVMKSHLIPIIPDLEVEAEAHDTWQIENYRSLAKRMNGPTFEVGGHPWRILLFPFGNNVEFASLYLEQGFEDKPPENWYACVQFALVLWNKNDASIYSSHNANHRFNAEEGDWGFTRFAELRKMFAPQWENHSRPMVEDEAVNVTAYVRVYKDPTGVLWHNFNNYDSKKETGMVGLKNQGATCYLNSLLQSLYFTNAFRKAIYQIPTEQDADRANSAWALQRLFYQLQSCDATVGTAELTFSFGWETRHIFEQQDVQELSRVLMERMEERMKGTAAENALAKMFLGKTKTYISCINVDYESSRIEDFWDIQLNVSGNKNLDDSFKDYIQVETMEGENKYSAEGYGLQDARKGVIFESFPQVLHLQLKRFEYDINRDAMMKVNDRYEFPEVFDAAPYLSDDSDKSEPWIYQLHGVLVHSGDITAGHYYAFLKPTKDGCFYKFDDERVTKATTREALEENFGGDYTGLPNGVGMRNPYTRTLSTKRSMSAYMLVYIRQSRLDSILQPVSDDDVPEHIKKQLDEEKAELARRKKERDEAHLYLGCTVVDEDGFKNYQGFDLIDWNAEFNTKTAPSYYRLLKTSTVGDLCAKIGEEKDLPPERIRLWVMVNRQNKTIRPDQPLLDRDQTIEDAYSKHGIREKFFRVWAEVATPVDDGRIIWPEVSAGANNTNNVPILIFLKYFDIENQTLKGVGHIYPKKLSKVSEMVPQIAKTMGWSAGSEPTLTLFEEIKATMIEPMKPRVTLQQAELQDGDVVCFQRQPTDQELASIKESGGFANAKDFYEYLLNCITIHMHPMPPSEGYEPFEITASRKASYEQFSIKVGEQLKVDPTHLRFWGVSSATNKPKAPIRRAQATTLYQMVNPTYTGYGSNQRNDCLYFEVLDMSLSELETKKALRVTWIPDGVVKEEIYDLLVRKTGTMADLLAELGRKAALPDGLAPELAIFTVQSGRILKEVGRDFHVSSIGDYSSICVQRELPEPDDRAAAAAADDDRPLFCFHFDKEPTKVHGVPFRFVVRPGETLKDAKPRLSAKTGIKGKPFDNIKFAIISRSHYAKPSYLNDDDVIYDLLNSDDLLALDHVNKTRTQANKNDAIFIR